MFREDLKIKQSLIEMQDFSDERENQFRYRKYIINNGFLDKEKIIELQKSGAIVPPAMHGEGEEYYLRTIKILENTYG